jgi:hypothetical protein
MSIYTPLNVKTYNQQSFSNLDDDLKQNRSFIKACLSRNGLLYEFLLSEFKNDKEIILIAFKQDQNVYNYIPDEFKEDLNFSIELVRIHPLIIDEFNSYLRNNKTIILTAINEIGVDALWHKNIEIYQNVEIMVAALKSQYGQDCWEPILCAAGVEAELSKFIIETAYEIHGDAVLDYDFYWLKNQNEIISRLEKFHPEFISHLNKLR